LTLQTQISFQIQITLQALRRQVSITFLTYLIQSSSASFQDRIVVTDQNTTPKLLQTYATAAVSHAKTLQNDAVKPMTTFDSKLSANDLSNLVSIDTFGIDTNGSGSFASAFASLKGGLQKDLLPSDCRRC
jgi:hypothetical protein